MLSSPTVILQPYGLPVYPQTTTCYPNIVQLSQQAPGPELLTSDHKLTAEEVDERKTNKWKAKKSL
ncbi:hypothetical protein PAMP_003027 [Pampus punctatissimus]